MAVYICTICGEKYDCDERPKECIVCGSTDFRLEKKSAPISRSEAYRETDAGNISDLSVKPGMVSPPMKEERKPEPVHEEQKEMDKIKTGQKPESTREVPGEKEKVRAGGAVGAVILIVLGGLVLYFKNRLIPFLYGQLGFSRIFRGVYPETVLISAGVLLIGCGVLLAVIWLVGFLSHQRKA